MSGPSYVPSDVSGRTFVITGANGGLGVETAAALARCGARVVMACRNTETARAAADRIDGETVVERLDLADLTSIRSFADRWQEPIDVLINNAGIMMVPQGLTDDGFESHFGTNHLGHFALTGLLLDRIRGRVVTVTSAGHFIASRRSLADPNYQHGRRYQPNKAYATSKVANLLFARELNRRLVASASPLLSLAAHPGVVVTGLYDHAPPWLRPLAGMIGGSLAEGAAPILRAAVGPGVRGGDYFGPQWQVRGKQPVRSPSSLLSKNERQAQALWTLSEDLSGVRYL